MGSLETSLYRLHANRIKAGQGAENEFKLPFDRLKKRFFDFIQVTFSAGQEAENEFTVPGDLLKHRFPDLN